MPPFRLLHAAGLDPEAIIARPPFEMVDLCERAPRHAFEQIGEAAGAQDVDCVLLCPASVPAGEVPNPLGLAGIEAFSELLNSLCERDVPVVLAATDHIPVWRRLVANHRRADLLRPGDRLPLSDRHDRSRAELYGLDAIPEGGASGSPSVCSIGVAPALGVADIASDARTDFDFLALGRGSRASRRIERCVAHCPGVPQARDPADVGPHGVTLIEVDGTELIETEFLSTAGVRFERFAVDSETDDDLDNLAGRMWEALDERPVETGEHGWVVSWTIRAEGEWLDRLETRRGREDLLALLPRRHQGCLVNHQLNVLPGSRRWIERPFAAEYRQALSERRRGLASGAERMKLVGLDSEESRHRRMMHWLSACDEQGVLDQAGRIGFRLAANVPRDPE